MIKELKIVISIRWLLLAWYCFVRVLKNNEFISVFFHIDTHFVLWSTRWHITLIETSQ